MSKVLTLLASHNTTPASYFMCFPFSSAFTTLLLCYNLHSVVHYLPSLEYKSHEVREFVLFTDEFLGMFWTK